MIRWFQNYMDTQPWDDSRDDFESVIEPLIWSVIAFAFVIIVIPVIVSFF